MRINQDNVVCAPRSIFRLLVSLQLLTSIIAQPLQASSKSLFSAFPPLDPSVFILVAAPVSTTGSYALNIYEQISSKRKCWESDNSDPNRIKPLLNDFDFTGICNRFIDSNGYSIRINDEDMATTYRIKIISSSKQLCLIGLPKSSSMGLPTLLIGKASRGNKKGDFRRIKLENQWQLSRRRFGDRSLGHLYIHYRKGSPRQPQKHSTDCIN